MQFFERDSVRVFLAAFALGFCHACGGGDDAVTANVSPGNPATPGSPTTATAGNRAPSIGGAAGAYARVGTPYEFLPTANDADGDPLTFSATNLPPWATLDPRTGRVVGTPDAGDVGAYESIVISVADATHVAKTSEFEITVLSAPISVASLQWETPPSKVDGSPLDNLAGYRILYGRNPEDLDHSVFVDGASVNTYEFADLGAGVWYFAVAAVNENGLEGPPSTTTMKSI